MSEAETSDKKQLERFAGWCTGCATDISFGAIFLAVVSILILLCLLPIISAVACCIKDINNANKLREEECRKIVPIIIEADLINEIEEGSFLDCKIREYDQKFASLITDATNNELTREGARAAIAPLIVKGKCWDSIKHESKLYSRVRSEDNFPSIFDFSYKTSTIIRYILMVLLTYSFFDLSLNVPTLLSLDAFWVFLLFV